MPGSCPLPPLPSFPASPASSPPDREGEKDDGACRDLVLVEDPEEAAATAALQEEMKALAASIPDGVATFTAI